MSALPPKRLRIEKSGPFGIISRSMSARPEAPARSQGVSALAACALMLAPAAINSAAAPAWFLSTAIRSGVRPAASTGSSGTPAAIRRCNSAPSPRSAAARFRGRQHLPAGGALGTRIVRHGGGHESGQYKDQPGYFLRHQLTIRNL